MDPEVAFALYKPHGGKDAELLRLIAEHLPTLRRLELVTDRAPMLLRSTNGTYLEIFEWRSSKAARVAHEHPEVAAIWESMGEVAEFPLLESLEESRIQFCHFTPVPVD